MDEAIIDHAMAADSGQISQADVGADGHGHHHAMLAAVFGHVADFVTDGVGRRGDSNGAALQADLAALGGSESEDGFGQLRAAGAYQSRESEDFAGADFEGHAADAGGARTEIAHFKRNL